MTSGNISFDIICITASCNYPVPLWECLAIRNLWSYCFSIGFCKHKLVISAFIGNFHDFLDNHNSILVFQTLTVSSFLIWQNRMHNKCIISIVNPYVSASIITISKITKCFFSITFRLIFRNFSRLRKTIIMLDNT